MNQINTMANIVPIGIAPEDCTEIKRNSTQRKPETKSLVLKLVSKHIQFPIVTTKESIQISRNK